MADKSALDQFLTPESMLTPGVAGALTMMITNALGTNFQMSRAWTALILSFFFGLLVLVSDKRIMMKALFYVLNSLVIFCVANGTNSVGLTQKASISVFGSAFAQSTNVATSDDLQKQYNELTSAYDEFSKKIESAKNNSTSKNDVIDLISQRDKVDQQRKTVALQLLAKGVKFNDDGSVLVPKDVFGGPNSVIRNPKDILSGSGSTNDIFKGVDSPKDFFSRWKF